MPIATSSAATDPMHDSKPTDQNNDPHTRRRVLRARARSLLAELIAIDAELDTLEATAPTNEGADLLDLRRGGAVEKQYAPITARAVLDASKRGELAVMKGRPPFVRRVDLEAWIATRGKKKLPAVLADFAGTYEATIKRSA